MENFLSRLNRNPYQPIDGASVTKFDELGNGLDDWGNVIAPRFEAPQQTWGETALGVATAPARLATALAGSLSPYGADGWQVPPIVNEGVNALTAVGDAYNYGMTDDEINSRALGMAGFMMGGGGVAAGRGGMVAANASKEGAVPAILAYRGKQEASTLFPEGATDIWASSSPQIASTYTRLGPEGEHWLDALPASERAMFDSEDFGGQAIAPVAMDFRSPLTLDAGGSMWSEIPFEGRAVSSDELASIARSRGHDGLVINNVLDEAPGFEGDLTMPSTTYAALQRGTVRSPLTGETLYSNASKEGAVPALANEFSSTFQKEGKNYVADGFIDDFDRAHVNWIGPEGLDPDLIDATNYMRHANNLNRSDLRQWRDQFLLEHPNVKQFTGFRQSGAKAANGGDLTQTFDALFSNASKESSIPALASALDMSPEARLRLEYDLDSPFGKTAYAIKDGYTVGEFSFDELPNALMMRDARVDPEFRRQGIASEVYGKLQDEFGLPMTPDITLTPEGYSLWKKNYPEAVKNYTFNGISWRPDGAHADPDLGYQAVADGVPDWRMSGGPNRPEGVVWSNADSKPALLAGALGQEQKGIEDLLAMYGLR